MDIAWTLEPGRATMGKSMRYYVSRLTCLCLVFMVARQAVCFCLCCNKTVPPTKKRVSNKDRGCLRAFCGAPFPQPSPHGGLLLCVAVG